MVRHMGDVTSSTAIEGHLDAGDCIGSWSGFRRWTDYHRFSLIARTTVVVELSSIEIDPYLVVFTCDGSRSTVVGRGDHDGSRNASRVVLQLEAGTYYIAVTKLDAPAGSYRLQVSVEMVSLDEPSVRRAIAERYKPLLYLHRDERYMPVGVEAMLDNASFWCSRDSYIRGPVYSATIAQTSCQWGSWLDIDQGYKSHASWWKSVSSRYETVVYYRVSEVGDWYTVQYWFFYVFNDAPASLGYVDYDHEGDWEGVQLWFRKQQTDLPSLIKGAIPEEIGYASHEQGAYHLWNDLQRVGWRPYVYVAEGSHASYPSVGDWRLNLVGDRWEDCWYSPQDHTTSSRLISDFELRDLWGAEWLRWLGRWGSVGEGYMAPGPTGPLFKDHWHSRPSQLVNRSEHPWLRSIPRCGP